MVVDNMVVMVMEGMMMMIRVMVRVAVVRVVVDCPSMPLPPSTSCLPSFPGLVIRAVLSLPRCLMML